MNPLIWGKNLLFGQILVCSVNKANINIFGKITIILLSGPSQFKEIIIYPHPKTCISYRQYSSAPSCHTYTLRCHWEHAYNYFCSLIGCSHTAACIHHHIIPYIQALICQSSMLALRYTALYVHAMQLLHQPYPEIAVNW